jgi:16S rRNA G966 N2-methylase RsmD
MLRPVIQSTRVLDLFAGTGRVGVGLLDEGADSVVGVDRRDPPEDLPEDYEWIRRDVPKFLNAYHETTYDIVYMDPPYDSRYAVELLPEASRDDLLSDEGIVAVETDYETELPTDKAVNGSLYLMRRRDYGGTRLWLYQEGREAPGYSD